MWESESASPSGWCGFPTAASFGLASSDQKFSDIFAVQDSISEDVADELALKMTSQERALLSKRYTANTEAYELYLKGNFFWDKRTREATKRAIEYYQQALDRDPSYALAYAGIVDCYQVLPIMSDVPSSEAFSRARAAALKALEIDAGLAEAHASLGYIESLFDRDWEGSKKEYQRACTSTRTIPPRTGVMRFSCRRGASTKKPWQYANCEY